MNGMSVIVKTITRITLVGILVFGFYLFLHGHISHGVGFAGGVLIALGLMQMLLAYGRQETERHCNMTAALYVAAVMGLLLAALALAGGMYGDFLPRGQSYALFSSGLVIIENIALCLAAAAVLFWIFLAIASFRKGERE